MKEVYHTKMSKYSPIYWFNCFFLPLFVTQFKNWYRFKKITVSIRKSLFLEGLHTLHRCIVRRYIGECRLIYHKVLTIILKNVSNIVITSSLCKLPTL